MQFISINPNLTIIDDSYNANINSALSAIRVLDKLSGYKILVLGDMKELGNKTTWYHNILKKIIFSFKINKILSIGLYTQIITKNFRHGKHFQNYFKLLQYLRALLTNTKIQTTILFKSSRNILLDHVIKNILQGNKK
ncbi:hypothetical protein HIC20_02170 [Buchnera aphidicola (Hormaphis cornu)]|nr:hypothetical protein HIC20_02170 [Buchnera aphidicola (Hormaphis cornu)]